MVEATVDHRPVVGEEHRRHREPVDQREHLVVGIERERPRGAQGLGVDVGIERREEQRPKGDRVDLAELGLALETRFEDRGVDLRGARAR